MTDDLIPGTAGDVPYVLRPPMTPRPDAPLVIAWHLMDAPRTERAFAAALPLYGLDAWRLYPGLPMASTRALPPEEVMRLGTEEPVLNLHGPLNAGAVAELPTVLMAVRDEHNVGEGPVAVVGGSAGGGVAGAAVVGRAVEARAAVLINPLLQLRPLVGMLAEMFGIDYRWSEESAAVADRMDLVAQADRLVGTPTRLIVGADDDLEAMRRPAERLRDALAAAGGRADLHLVDDLAHPLAEEPGLDPAPQIPQAVEVDRLAVAWLAQAFELA